VLMNRKGRFNSLGTVWACGVRIRLAQIFKRIPVLRGEYRTISGTAVKG
jgi:hypothetical protein